MARIATIQKKEDLAPEHQPIYDSIVRAGVLWVVPSWGCCTVPSLRSGPHIWAVMCALNRASITN